MLMMRKMKEANEKKIEFKCDRNDIWDLDVLNNVTLFFGCGAVAMLGTVIIDPVTSIPQDFVSGTKVFCPPKSRIFLAEPPRSVCFCWLSCPCRPY